MWACRNVQLTYCVSGITSFEEIIAGAVEAFNMDRDLAAALAAFGLVSPILFLVTMKDNNQ